MICWSQNWKSRIQKRLHVHVLNAQIQGDDSKVNEVVKKCAI